MPTSMSGSSGSYTYRSTFVPEITLKVGGTWYPGTDIVGEAVGTGDGATSDYALDFAYIKNPVIYVDGIEQASTVTVDTGVPINSSNMGAHLELVPNVNSYNKLFGNPMTEWTYTTSGISGSGIYYNPHWDKGIASYTAAYSVVEVSDDCSTWVVLNTSGASANKAVPVAYQNSKYWRITFSSSSSKMYNMVARDIRDTQIHFTTPPPVGAVITADYTSETITKDVNHVFDMSVVISMGEYTE